MANLSKKLEILFRDYLIRKEKEKHIVPSYEYSGGYCRQNNWMQDDDKYDGVIYFYEWSNADSSPTLFYNVGAFDAFLRRCNIFMAPFQKDIIFQLDRAFVSCKKGTHELLIRGSRQLLVEALGRCDSPGVDIKTAGDAIMNTPAPIGCGHPPGLHLVFEPPRSVSPMYNGHPDEWCG